MEIESLKLALAELKYPGRTEGGHILHKLEDIIIIGLFTILCNGEYFTNMEVFGELREEWLRLFLELPHGIPDSDTFRRVFERSDPEALAKYLCDWLACHWEKGTVAAIDGKTIRGSKSKKHKAYHVVSAFATENQMVLGELITEEKSNEITAVPELLDTLYVIDLKRNQPTLLEEVSLYFQAFSQELSSLVTRDKDHGRIEKREYCLLTDQSWLPERSEWAGLKSVGCVCSTVTRNGATSTDIRFFITSLPDINRFTYAVRKHWSIENQLHWSLDVIFEEDSFKARKKYASPQPKCFVQDCPCTL